MRAKRNISVTAACLSVSVIQPVLAAEFTGYSGTNLNIRSGPSVRFPTVGVLGAGTALAVHGCLSRYTWCDVTASGLRGWVSAAQIKMNYRDRRVYAPAYAKEVRVLILSFSVGSYWFDHYRDQDFYGERDRWTGYRWKGDGLPPGWREDWDADEDDEY